MKDVKDQIWAYLHDELPADERERFEQALADDASLRDALEECRAMHEDLEQLSDLRLEDQLLAEWEAEHPQFQEERKPGRAKIIRFTLPLAAAAAIILLLALPLSQGPVHWQRTLYGIAPQLRGYAETQARYSRADLKRINTELQSAIEEHLAALPTPPADWKLQIQLQELAGGHLAVEVSGHPVDQPDVEKLWEDVFQSQTSETENISSLARRIATDIAEQKAP